MGILAKRQVSMLVGGMLEVEKENWAVQRINLKSGLREDKEYQQKGVEELNIK